eukprot:scaffold8843_cov76-Cyclotella_meneghiniana.AAC.4
MAAVTITSTLHSISSKLMEDKQTKGRALKEEGDDGHGHGAESRRRTEAHGQDNIMQQST